MGVRIRYEFTSDFEGVEWRCDIHDSDYAAGINTANGNGFNITYNGNGSSPLANVFGSSCELTLMWGDNDAFYTGFINDLKAANEHEFALVIYKDSSLYWVGNITGDSLMWNNENTQRELVINAIDGLGRLRQMNYDSILPGVAEKMTDTKQVFEVLLDLLSLNNLSQFWGASDAYIEFEPHWVLNTSYRDWLDRLSVPRLVFLDRTEEEERVNDEPKSAYDCLEIILTHLNMRIHHSDGRYFLQQVMGMTGANAAYRYTYYKGNTPISSSPWKWWQSSATTVARNAAVGTDVDVLAGGKFSYFQGLQRVEVKVPDRYFAYYDIQNSYPAVDVGGGVFVSGKLLTPATLPKTESTDLGVVKGGTGTGKRIRFNYSFSVDTLILSPVNLNKYFLRVRTKIIAGSYRLWDNGVNNGTNLTWTTTDTSHSVYIDRQFDRGEPVHITILTPEIPFTISPISVDVTYDIIDRNTQTSYVQSPVKLSAKIEEFDIFFLANDEPIKRSKVVVNNPTITNYENNTLYKHPDYLLDDVGLVTNQNAFQLNTTTTTFVDVTEADSGHSTDRVISETIAQDAMALQIHPIRVYEGAITGNYEPYKTFQYGTDYYVFNGGTFNAVSDEWNCQWWQSSPEVGTIGNPDRNDGRGWTYDGDNRVRPYRQMPTNWDHYGDVKDVMYGETIGGSGGNYSDAITTLTINSATESLFKNGDVVQIYNPETLEMLQEVTLTADVDATDTSISFSSVTLGNNIPPDSKIMLKGSEGLATPMLRTDEIQINGNTYTDIPTVPTLNYGSILRTSVVTWTPVSTGYQVLSIGTLSDSDLLGFTYSNSTHKLTYTGNTSRFRVSYNLEFYTSLLSDRAGAVIVHTPSGGSDTQLLESRCRRTIGTALDMLQGQCLIELSSGDTLYIGVARETGSGEVNAQNISMTITQAENA